MAIHPRDLPAIGDDYGNGVVSKAVATAEGIEVTVREAMAPEDTAGGEDRPVSISQQVHPDALENVGDDEREEAEKVTADEQAEINRTALRKREQVAADEERAEKGTRNRSDAPESTKDNVQAKNENKPPAPSATGNKAGK